MGKTPFQRHREDEEKKKKRAEAEAAKLYEDFVESFGEGDDDEKSFVKGEAIQPGSSQSMHKSGPSGSVGPKKGSSKYVPSFIPPMMAAALSGKEEREGGRRSEESVFPLPSSGRGDRGKPRNIDKMLETMKREQDARSERQRQRRERGSSFGDPGSAVDDGLGSFDDGDPYTTNLYVGNLATSVDEEVLKREFLRYGDIASIKVMWPRDDDQRRRSRNCGFVAYMTRQGAEKAKQELNGILLHDLDLKIGWGKAVVLPPIPVYTQSGVGGLGPMLAAAKAKAMSSHAPPGQQAPAPWKVPEPELDPQQGFGPELVVKVPEDSRARFIVDSVACYVLVDGCAFEQALMTREAQNPEYTFLFDLASPDHLYYRWRLYSLSQGDSLRNWRNEPFVMVEGGPRWVPPPLTAAASANQQTAAQRGGEAKDKDNPLSDMQRDRFEDVLRALTMERTKICEAMVFAIDNADSAAEVVEILSDSLTLSETPMTTKVARLMLASDVLHNTTAPVRNASRYRGLLEACLPEVFESMQETYALLDSKINQEVLRRNVLRVLRIWRSWYIFSDDFLNGLQATFLKGGAEVGPNPALQGELEALDSEALALRCRRNGLSRQGDRDAMISRLISLQAYLHGELPTELQIVRRPRAADEALPMGLTEDSQGVFTVNAEASNMRNIPGGAGAAGAGPVSVLGPVALPPQEKKKAKPVDGPVSKWTLVDYDDETTFLDRPEEEKDIFQDLAATPPMEGEKAGSPHPAAGSSPEPDALTPAAPLEAEVPESRGGGERMDAAEEGRRARLRQVEVELLLLREELEDKGLEKGEVELHVEREREKLMSTAEQANEAEVEKETEAVEKPSTSNREKRDRSKLESKSSKDGLQKGSKRARSRERSQERSRARSGERGKGAAKRARTPERSQELSRARSQERSRAHRSRSLSADDRSRRSRKWEGRGGREGGGKEEAVDRKESRKRSRSPSRERRRSRSRERSRSRGGAEKERGGRARSRSRDRAKDSKQAKKRERSDSRDRLESKASKKGSKEESRKDAPAKSRKDGKKEKARSKSPKKSKKEHGKRK